MFCTTLLGMDYGGMDACESGLVSRSKMMAAESLKDE